MDLSVSRGDKPPTEDNRKNTLVLFDIDGTLTLPRQNISDVTDTFLQSLKTRVSVGLVGGSDLTKIAEQTMPPSLKKIGYDPIDSCVIRYDYVFAENGLVAYKAGQLIRKKSLLNHLGEHKLQRFINFCLAYMSNLKLPAKRGNFIELRNGMLNICPVGRSCSQLEREQFNAYDAEHGIRKKFIEQLEKAFGPDSKEPLGLKFSIGGQISLDAFPVGWDKTFCLNLIDSSFEKVFFFGDKTHPGGNDHEIFLDERTTAFTVSSPADTIEQVKALNL